MPTHDILLERKLLTQLWARGGYKFKEIEPYEPNFTLMLFDIISDIREEMPEKFRTKYCRVVGCGKSAYVKWCRKHYFKNYFQLRKQARLLTKTP